MNPKTITQHVSGAVWARVEYAETTRFWVSVDGAVMWLLVHEEPRPAESDEEHRLPCSAAERP